MKLRLSTVFTALVLGIVVPASAQTDHSTHGTAKPASAAANGSMADGLVKKVDKSKGRVTLAHGALPNGMPPMTMAYKVKDAAWLDQLKVGQKIRFATDPKDGDMTVLRYELVK
jgi:Cu(I)/Ag(I) efflux system periplasmic protein CusF